jgi:hypothetical protein
LRLNLAKHTSEDSEFRMFCKQAFVFQGHFDVVDCVFTHPQSLVDDASVDSDADCLPFCSTIAALIGRL